jgi:hypothetical protein
MLKELISLIGPTSSSYKNAYQNPVMYTVRYCTQQQYSNEQGMRTKRMLSNIMQQLNAAFTIVLL